MEIAFPDAGFTSPTSCQKPLIALRQACPSHLKHTGITRSSHQNRHTQAVYKRKFRVAAGSIATAIAAEPAQLLRSEDLWQTFTRNVAGEWEGVTATFGPDGHPEQLPEAAVPREYSDWDITLYDWQSQCSMLPTSSGIQCLTKRIMPTVGCEADAQTFLQESRSLFEAPPADSSHSVLRNGTYSTSNCLSLSDAQALRCEHCIMLGEQHRIRLVQHLTSAKATEPWQLASVELHHERYDQPYNAGAQLSGCGGGMNNFAEHDTLDASRLQQEWNLQSSSSFDMSSSGSAQPSQALQR